MTRSSRERPCRNRDRRAARRAADKDLLQYACRALSCAGQRQRLDQASAYLRIALEGDRVRRLAHQYLLRKEMAHRPDHSAVAQSVADRDRLRIARQPDYVVLSKDAPLVEDRTADFAQHNAVLIRYEALVGPGILHGLELDPAHAAPLRRVAQDIAALTVIDAFAHSGNEVCTTEDWGSGKK
jgi:hypothetical protein